MLSNGKYSYMMELIRKFIFKIAIIVTKLDIFILRTVFNYTFIAATMATKVSFCGSPWINQRQNKQ